MLNLQEYFSAFRKNIIGINQCITTPYGEFPIIYADWIASGRLYAPIETVILEKFAPLVGNTHSESSTTGAAMTLAYHEAQYIIKKHVNANKNDVLIASGSGMTGVINKFIRILGLRVVEQLKDYFSLPDELRPVVFISHMEHHSNHTTWLETIADVEVLPPNAEGLVDPSELEIRIERYKNRKLKIGAFTACSNVTGIQTPFYELAEIMHKAGGYCFIDFACSAPYVKIDMHPEDPLQQIDAIFFSPHKFLGGPGTPGILIFNSQLYKNKIPDHPGGGTVDWTNPWGHHRFTNSIETREDGGTPPFLQTIKAALSIKLKESMQPELMQEREHEIVELAFRLFGEIEGLNILAPAIKERLAGLSFYFTDIHYNLVVRLLNDRFGIQSRGGCSCAGTYGHYLLHVDRETSNRITSKIDSGDLSEKPGWVRLSFHPTTTDEEVKLIAEALKAIRVNLGQWSEDYIYDNHNNEYYHKSGLGSLKELTGSWFNLPEPVK